MSICHLVCYAAGAPVHIANRDRLVASAVRYGIDDVLICGPDDIDSEFRARHRALLEAAEGSGYWIWKPYFILRALQNAAPGDIILYVDSGAFLRRSPGDLWSAGDADAVFFKNDYLNKCYTKRDAFILTGTDCAACHESRQLDAAMIAFRNTPAARQFVEDWLAWCTDPRLVSDAPNTCGEPDLPGFAGHRHDQAILSLLLWRDGQKIKHVLHPRSRKHSYIVHHRRRNPNVPIWWWHLFHDGAEALLRRLYDYDFRRAAS